MMPQSYGMTHTCSYCYLCRQHVSFYLFYHLLPCYLLHMYRKDHGFKSHSNVNYFFSLNFFLNFFSCLLSCAYTCNCNDQSSFQTFLSGSHILVITFFIFAVIMKLATPHLMLMIQTGLELRQVLECVKQFGS